MQLILRDCLPLRTLGDLLDRTPDTIRNHYVNPMLQQGLLEARYPDEPTHPQQAYRTLLSPGISKVSDTPPFSKIPENTTDTSNPPTTPES